MLIEELIMAKSKVVKNGANKKLHTKLRKRKMAKEKEAKISRKMKLKELAKRINITENNSEKDA